MIIMLTFSFYQMDCKDDSSIIPPSESAFSLSAFEIISTEALIKIEYAHSDSITIQLQRNGHTIANSLKIYKEYIYNDTLLQPKQNYTYTAYKIENGGVVDSSRPLQITTMDTTSNNFIWETFSFGNGSSSVINDVAIINDTLIYAVGEIYILDSTGQDEILYNAVKWDGKKWNLMRVPSKGSVTYPPHQTIWVISKSNILFSWGGGIITFDGINFTDDMRMNSLLSGAINKIFAFNSHAIYAVGNNGSIVHYNGSSWQKLESGTTLTIGDIWGVAQQNNNTSEVFCAATSNTIEQQGTKLLRISSTNDVDSLPWNSPWFNYSVWTATGKTLYLCGSSLLKYRNGNITETDFGIFLARIRGNANNDITVVGDFGFVSHYNGNKWQSYPELYHSNMAYRSLAMKGNTIAAIGFKNNAAVITIGKRIN